MKMLTFDSRAKALEYAEELGKYDYMIAEVEGKRAFLCATVLPLEALIRSHVETIVTDFLKEMDLKDEKDIDDIANEIGAEISGDIEVAIENTADVHIICAHLDF